MERVGKKMIEKRVVVEGRVQGVGFRAMVKKTARQYGLKGVVRNLPRGQVEFHIQGPIPIVESFITTICERPFVGEVSSFFIEDVTIQGLYEGFEILF